MKATMLFTPRQEMSVESLTDFIDISQSSTTKKNAIMTADEAALAISKHLGK